jgi:hypothetical protein
MSDTTNDEKIQQLVRSVLEAVDARLAGVRAEMLAAASDVQHRHQQLLDTVVALQQRVDTLNQQRTSQDATIATLRSEIAALHATTIAAPPPTHAGPPPSAADPSPEPWRPAPRSAEPAGLEPHHEPPFDLSSFTRPLMNDVHVTSQLPIVPMIEPMSFDDRLAPAPAPHDVLVERDDREAVDWANASAESQAAEEMIDLERLTRLLSDKLEHITLPHTD